MWECLLGFTFQGSQHKNDFGRVLGSILGGFGLHFGRVLALFLEDFLFIILGARAESSVSKSEQEATSERTASALRASKEATSERRTSASQSEQQNNLRARS